MTKCLKKKGRKSSKRAKNPNHRPGSPYSVQWSFFPKQERFLLSSSSVTPTLQQLCSVGRAQHPRSRMLWRPDPKDLFGVGGGGGSPRCQTHATTHSSLPQQQKKKKKRGPTHKKAPTGHSEITAFWFVQKDECSKREYKNVWSGA